MKNRNGKTMENTPTIRNTIVNKYIMYSIVVLLLL